nr:hypothetical protein [uncultured Rhodopila sp.]
MANTGGSSSKVSAGAGRGRKVPITLRIDEVRFKKLALLAEAENRTPTNYVETALLRDMAAKEEAARVITMFVPPEAAGVTAGPLLRSEGESDERYAERSALFDRLFDIPDSDQ